MDKIPPKFTIYAPHGGRISPFKAPRRKVLEDPLAGFPLFFYWEHHNIETSCLNSGVGEGAHTHTFCARVFNPFIAARMPAPPFLIIIIKKIGYSWPEKEDCSFWGSAGNNSAWIGNPCSGTHRAIKKGREGAHLAPFLHPQTPMPSRPPV